LKFQSKSISNFAFYIYNTFMPRYYSSFAAGFEALASDSLGRDVPLQAMRILEGALVYDTFAKPDVIRAIKYFKNSFIVLQEAAGVQSLENFAGAVTDNMPKIHAPNLARTFHIVSFYKNQPVGLDGAIKARLIDAIAGRTRLRYCSGHGDVEFWLTARGDGTGFFMQRITGGQDVKAGELEPHIAALLCLAGGPKDEDIFIDPFCGSGAIPLARARLMPYRGIFAMDIDAALTGALKIKVKAIKNSKIQNSFFIKAGDFLAGKFDSGFADAIVTDPPWGLHEQISADFYTRAIGEFVRVLKTGGKLVLLTAREIEIPPHPALTQTAQYDVLIHGKKASVRVFAKN